MDAENKWGRLSPLLAPEVHKAILGKEYEKEKGKGHQAVFVGVACPGAHPRDADYRKMADNLKRVHEEFGIKGSLAHPLKCLGTCLNGRKYVLTAYVVLTPSQAKKYLAQEGE